MEAVSMSSLLLNEEESIKRALQADAEIDHNRRQTLERLNDTMDRTLLRYNAANADDPVRQAVADCQTAAVRDMLGLLLAGTAQKDIEKRRFRVSAVICLLLAVICGLVSALLMRRSEIAAWIAMAVAVVIAFLAGRLWYGEREVRVCAELDPDVVWRTLRKSVDTMDRKASELLAQDALWHREAMGVTGAAAGLNAESVSLIGDLLEALYANNGDYALRQLKKLLPWLRRQGIEAIDCSEETRDFFEILPTKRDSATLRPALISDGRLLLAGRATQHVD